MEVDVIQTKKTMLLVIPSIDIKDGKTVRVVQGIPELNSKEYGNDPVEMAMIWRTENAKFIHVVDFDSAHDHSHKNFDIIREICDSVIIPVELGGGIKSMQDAEQAFELGVFRIVIGSMFCDCPEDFKKLFEKYGPKRISTAIDVVDNQVVIHSRKELTGNNPVEYAKKLREIGVERFIVTDVKTNGMLGGPNIELSKSIADATGAKVTLSGGIRDYTDLMNVQNEGEPAGIDSVIIGRALYENRFPCQKIWRVAESGLFA